MSRHLEMSEPRPEEMMMQPRTFCCGGIGGPDRIAAGAEERVGVRRLGLGGIEGVVGIGVEDARLLGAAAVGLHVDHFLVVPRQRQRDLAAEIFRGLGVEDIGVGLAGRGVELAGGEAAAAGNALVVGELEQFVGVRERKPASPGRQRAPTSRFS